MKKFFKMLFMLAVAFFLMLVPSQVKAASVPTIKYQVHVENSGWLSAVRSGKTAGTTGKSYRLEALKITLKSGSKSMISYRAHVADIGWQGWKTSGQTAGTTGKSKAIEAVQIKLTGLYAKKYDVYYRVHVAYKGWLGWAKNGQTAGSTGLGLRTEAIQIKLVKKGAKVSTGGKATLTKPVLSYKGYSGSYGWQKNASEGKTAGTTGKSYRLEALKIYLKDFDGKNGISYRAHVANVGWQNWVTYGKTAGTTGKSYAIEAVQIKLSDSLSSYFDIYYRVHSANIGWLGWAKNGETAGTTGGGIQAEAIQIKLVPKGSAFSTGGTAYIDAGKTTEIILQHHMTTSLCQWNYSAFSYSDGTNSGCCATAYAIGLSIVTGQSYDPTAYWNRSEKKTYYTAGHLSGYSSFNASAVYAALKNGKPTMIHYIWSTGQHWVLIMGIRQGADPNNLTYGDFIVIDPGTGTQKSLTSCGNWAGSTVGGMNVFK